MDVSQELETKELKRLALAQARARRKTIFIATISIIAIVLISTAIITLVMKNYQKQISELSAIVERYEAEAAVYEEASDEVSFAVLESSIQDVGKLVSAEYWYTDVGKYEDIKQVWGVDVALTKKSFLVKWSGVITAGIDLSRASITANESNKLITVTLPKAEIISHDPDNESFRTIDEKSGLFNPISVDDVRKFDLVSESAMVERATASSLLDRAEKNAASIISEMVQANPQIQGNYTVKVEFVNK